MITIGKHSFESWRKSKISNCSFGNIVDMESMLEFFSIVPTYPLSNIIKQLCLVYQGGYYGMSEARFVDSFQHILDLGIWHQS